LKNIRFRFTFYLLPGYKHPFCIFAGYRIRMKREILYQRIAGTIAWQTDTLFYILTGTDIRINQHLRTGNEIERDNNQNTTVMPGISVKLKNKL
jgi:hypothetical protein